MLGVVIQVTLYAVKRLHMIVLKFTPHHKLRCYQHHVSRSTSIGCPERSRLSGPMFTSVSERICLFQNNPKLTCNFYQIRPSMRWN